MSARLGNTYRGARRGVAKAEAKRQQVKLRQLWPQYAMLSAHAVVPSYLTVKPPTGKRYRNKGMQEAARRVRQMEDRVHG